MPVLAPISMPGISTILPQALQQMSVPPSVPPTQSVQIQTDPHLSPNPTILQPGTATADPKVIPLISITPPTPSPQGVTPPGLNFPKPAQSSKDTEKGSFPTPNTTPETWDGWLNGALEADFTWEELDRTGDLRVHWARKDYGSRAELVDNNPDATPSQLLVGRCTLHGKQKPASDISPVYNNCDHIAKDRQRVINGVKYSGGDSFVSGFRDFHHDFPGFIVHAVFGEINMICLQNEFMRSRLGGGFKCHMEPVNGIVSDAAHGFWRGQNSLLITSSIYKAELHCWIPVLFSYSDGASSEHYTHHFLILDFSQAEQGGFMAAFVAFWMQQPENERSEDELYRAAEVLLQGCEEHFRASVTRIKKIHSVVPVHSETHFEELALGLLSAKDLGDFYARAEFIQRNFPLSNSWLGWWLRDSVATMLFETHTCMEPDVWNSIPSTTNAQEAQHWKLYSAIGRDHGLLEEGGLIRYGKAEPWKAMINLIGRSKPSQAPGGRSAKQSSDGQPPDTKKDLLSKIPKTPKKAKESQSTHRKNPVIGPASYCWDNMSCWADLAWDILYRSIVKDWASFSSRFDSDTQTEQPIHDFYNLMLLQQDAESKALVLKIPDYDLSAALSDQRDRFRCRLAEWRILKSDHAVGNAFWPSLSEFEGNLSLWLQTYANVKHSPQTLPTCWRSRDGQLQCKGSQTDVKFILSLPVVLILEEEEGTQSTELWDFPVLLQSYKHGKLSTMSYDIVGHIFYSRSKNHYISQFLDEDGETVWTYDDMAHGGCPYVEAASAVNTHLTGWSSTVKLPSDFIGSFAVYHLRGGTKPQEAIYTSQLATAQQVHHMTVKPENLQNQELTWLKNPFRLDTLDYNEVIESSGTIHIPPRSNNPSYQPTDMDIVTNEHESSPFLPSPTLKRSLELSSESLHGENSVETPIWLLNPGLDMNLAWQYLQEDSPNFWFRCRCGITTMQETLVVNDGNTGDIIQCNSCDIWSHIACQKEGRAGGLRQKLEPFECDNCAGNLRAILDSFIPGKRCPSRAAKLAQMAKQKLHTRLRGRDGVTIGAGNGVTKLGSEVERLSVIGS
ncbi:hypothetical protein GG344DRAFT_71155, partial [Lentinula edodes]